MGIKFTIKDRILIIIGFLFPNMIDKINNIIWTDKLYKKVIKLSNHNNKKILKSWLYKLIYYYDNYFKEITLSDYNLMTYDSDENIPNISILDFLKQINNNIIN